MLQLDTCLQPIRLQRLFYDLNCMYGILPESLVGPLIIVVYTCTSVKWSTMDLEFYHKTFSYQKFCSTLYHVNGYSVHAFLPIWIMEILRIVVVA